MVWIQKSVANLMNMMAGKSNDGNHCDKHFHAPENLKFNQIFQLSKER